MPAYLLSQTTAFKFEKTKSFFPEGRIPKEYNAKIDWGYLIVPENWDIPDGKAIKIATAILKSTQKRYASNPVVFISGGPGASGINSIWNFLSHPLREKSDIVLIDFRGTGFSFPKFCPELGNEFLEILSKNQNRTEDEQQKVVAAMACKQDLINRGIDINAYNSKSIAKDLNAFKNVLKYDKWNVYGVSYGTYIAQVYVNDFPQDVKSLILDSSIPDISEYYYKHSNTNYINSLKKVFELCKNDPDCNKQYPNLEETFYEIIEKLNKNPITVKVEKKILPSGMFTYNVEDFKICIQQCLYNKKLIEVLPLLINEFKKENTHTLSSLVKAFSGSLRLDYGAFYCVTCNEAFPYNSILEFEKSALQYKKLKGSLSFYKSDFMVCDKWNLESNKFCKVSNDLSHLSALALPVLVFSGGFDPITPVSNGKITVEKFTNGFLVKAPTSGHGPSFSKNGREIIDEFIRNPNQHPHVAAMESESKVNFVTNIKTSNGISNLANSLNELNFLFLSPLALALIILVISILCFSYSLIKSKKDTWPNRWTRLLIVLSSLFAVFSLLGFCLAINDTTHQNFYILVFGLPEKYSYLFIAQWSFVILTIVTILHFMINFRKISNASVITVILFSLILIATYFQYWEFI